MRYTFEEEFRLDHPETVGETDSHFDLENYKDWLEAQLIEARKQLALANVVHWVAVADAQPDRRDLAYLTYDESGFMTWRYWKGTFWEGEHIANEPKVTHWTIVQPPFSGVRVCTCEMPAKMKGKNQCWRCKKPFKEFLQTDC